MDDDNELRDALRSHLRSFAEGAEEDEEGDFWDNDGIAHPFHGKAGLIERMVDNAFKTGMANAFRLFHEEHGCYPPLPDPSKPHLAFQMGPPAVWRGEMSDEVRVKIREYATHHIDPHGIRMGGETVETPEGRERVLEFLTNRWAQSGLADALEKHYAEHRCYPDYADLPKFDLKICF